MMTWPIIRSNLSVAACLIIFMAAIPACESRPRQPERTPTIPVLRLTQHVGGTHYRTLVHEGAWYQGFGPDLLVLEPRSNRLLETIPLGEVGRTGPVIDMLVHDNRLYVVVEDHEVVELSIATAQSPRILSREPASSLGIKPKRLSAAADELFISGEGGVVRWRDGRRIFSHDDDVSRVAMSERGLVACIGRRIIELPDGQYAGSASDLIPAQLDDVEPGTLVFTRHGARGALVGLMTPELREVDAERCTVAVLGAVRSVRVFHNRVWIVSDEEILSYIYRDGQLQRIRVIDILGARDVAPIDENHLAVAGSFGRAIYRIRSTQRGPGDSFLYAHREPSRLSRAISDGRHILAGGEEGNWLYLIGSRVDPTDMALDEPEDPPTTAETMGARAVIDEHGRSLLILRDGESLEHYEPDDLTLHTVVAADGRFWIGHDRGVTVLELATPAAPRSRDSTRPTLEVAERFRLDGPVRYLYPLRTDDGVSYVAEFGGLGILRTIQEPAPAAAPRR